jgi:hypothetical protein
MSQSSIKMNHKRSSHSANHRTMLLMLVITWPLLCSAEAKAEDNFSIKTLPPDYAEQSADALLSDWKGQHWASLDADQDKVALSWTTTPEEAIFQVSRQKKLQFSFFNIWRTAK